MKIMPTNLKIEENNNKSFNSYNNLILYLKLFVKIIKLLI